MQIYKSVAFKYLVLLILLSGCAAYSQYQLPPVHNFGVMDYNAGNQNWDIVKSGNYIYAANNEGLLEYDGIKWRLYPLPNKTIIRSVAVDSDRIYTGSYEEFGYWERQDNGELKYQSLSERIGPEKINTETIWGIYPFDGKVIFKSFSSLFVYENQDLNIITSDATLMAANVINNEFFVFGSGKGIYKLDSNQLNLIPETGFLKDYKVQSITPYKLGKTIIGTSLHGCFIMDDNGIHYWDIPLNGALKENQLNEVSYSIGGKVFFGTIKKGLFVYNETDNTFYNIYVKNGLQNNTVLGCFYHDDVVWLALDNGISAIPINGYAYYLNPEKVDIGAVYDMVILNGVTYIATNTGIHKIDRNGISFIEGSQDHTWDLTVVGNDIICGHNLGTYRITEDQFIPITSRNGGYVFKQVPKEKNLYIQGNYKGLSLYTKKEDGSWDYESVKNIDFPVKEIVFEKPNVAWVAHPYKGVYKVRFSQDYTTVEEVNKNYNREFPNIYDIKLYTIEGNIAFYSADTWFVYNVLEDEIKPFNSLNNLLGSNKAARPISDTSMSPLVFKKNDGTLFLRRSIQDSESEVYIPSRFYKGKLVSYDERAVVVSDSLVYIGLYNDILAIKPFKVTNNVNVSEPLVNRIYKNGIPQSLHHKVSVHQKDTLTVEASIPFLSNANMSYTVSNNGFWEFTEGKIVLSGFSHGDNLLKIRASNSNNTSDILEIPFYVEYPWYMGGWGILLFIAIVFFIIYIILTINKYVLIRHKKYLDEQYEHQKELHRKEEAIYHEKKINEMLKEQHKIDLNSKTKELANTAMAMTKKNELLQKLKSELLQFKTEIINKGKFERLIKNIDKNISSSKDWEVFESNFNEIHDSFFKKLLELHPDHLTPKDLKLCAYLKMNLSTKEIAPLMGISIRGVEIHRYRLRKRLGLETEQNLNEYLMSIS